MCLVCLFALFDIIRATSNSPSLDVIVALILELRKYQSNFFFIITLEKCIMFFYVDVERKIFVIICIVIVSIENPIVSRRKTNK